MKSAAAHPNLCDVITLLEDRKQQVTNDFLLAAVIYFVFALHPIGCYRDFTPSEFLSTIFSFLFFCENLANASATTASVTTQENNSFMSNVMLLSPLNDDGSNSLTSTLSVAMETDQSVYDLQKEMQQRTAGE